MTINVDARKCLLLNASYEPIQAISLRTAAGLLMKGVAIAVVGVAANLRTPSTIYPIPSVLRLKRYVNVPHRTIQCNKRNVMRRDQFTCIFCGLKVGDKKDGKALERSNFTIDHLIPLSKGGKNTWSNMACACHPCNHRKGARTPHEAGLKLRWEPKRPRTSYLVLGGDIPREWKIYINI